MAHVEILREHPAFGRLVQPNVVPGILMRNIAEVLLLSAALLLAVEPLEAQRGPRSEEPRAQRGWLGISFDPERQAAGEYVVEEVALDSPAEAADIKPGDRIVQWNGSAAVADALRGRRLSVGDTVQLRIAREGERDRDLTLVAEPRELFVERRAGRDRDVIVIRPGEILRRMRINPEDLEESIDSVHARLRVLLRDSLGPRIERLERRLPNARIEILPGDSAFMFRDGLGMAVAGGRSAVAGAALADLTPELGSYFGSDRGALVLRVAPDTPASEAGLLEGDVIVKADDTEITSVADLRRAVGPRTSRARPRPPVDGSEARDAPVELDIIRRGNRYSITLNR